MTAAQVRAAAEIVEAAALLDNEIVTFIEVGSEGAIFYSGAWKHRSQAYLIARDGTYRNRGPISEGRNDG